MIKELGSRNMSSANILKCLAVHGWNLSLIQLRDLHLHPLLRLLMRTPPDQRLIATARAEALVREHLVSGQAIRYGREYTLTNIRLSGVFVSQ